MGGAYTGPKTSSGEILMPMPMPREQFCEEASSSSKHVRFIPLAIAQQCTQSRKINAHFERSHTREVYALRHKRQNLHLTDNPPAGEWRRDSRDINCATRRFPAPVETASLMKFLSKMPLAELTFRSKAVDFLCWVVGRENA